MVYWDQKPDQIVSKYPFRYVKYSIAELQIRCMLLYALWYRLNNNKLLLSLLLLLFSICIIYLFIIIYSFFNLFIIIKSMDLIHLHVGNTIYRLYCKFSQSDSPPWLLYLIIIFRLHGEDTGRSFRVCRLVSICRVMVVCSWCQHTTNFN